MNLRSAFTVFIAWSCLASQLDAQQLQPVVEKPQAPLLVRSYQGTRLHQFS